jgi:hypothetical protein
MGDSEIEHYKRMAERCEPTAEALPNTEEKRQFKEQAQHWRDLAKHAAREGKERSKAERLILASATKRS